ncbi:MAG: MBL fold metallo-hydrolase [Gemmatimonadales bacterium]
MLLSALLASLLLTQHPLPGDSLVITLLGTGTPQPRSDRFGPATLIEAGGRRLLFDAGRGVPIRLEEAGIRTGSVQVVFLTHHHSDHTTGLPDLWLTGWLPPFGGRSTPLRVIGPTGTRGLVEGLRTAFAEDLRIRVAEEHLPPAGSQLVAEEFASDTIVFNEDGVVVEAFLVDHGGELKPAYGYRVSYAGRSVVISGDTRYSPNLIAHAQRADVLLHEVAMAPAAVQDQPPIRFILSHHTSPAEVARVFALTSPRLAVLTHFALPPTRQAGADLTPDMVLAATRALYPGRLEGGRDLMRITVSDSIRVGTAGVAR